MDAAQQRVAELDADAVVWFERNGYWQAEADRLTADNARLQAAIRELIKTLRINCPHGNAVADCYDIPTYTGEE